VFAVETTGGSIEGRGRGVDVKLLRRLKAGELPVEARLDLHGHARADGLDALERFFERARAGGKRCLLVIHGRGAHSRDDAPVLKPLVCAGWPPRRRRPPLFSRSRRPVPRRAATARRSCFCASPRGERAGPFARVTPPRGARKKRPAGWVCLAGGVRSYSLPGLFDGT